MERCQTTMSGREGLRARLKLLCERIDLMTVVAAWRRIRKRQCKLHGANACCGPPAAAESEEATGNYAKGVSLMGLLPDWQIKRDVKIEPFADRSTPGAISYGVTSYG